MATRTISATLPHNSRRGLTVLDWVLSLDATFRQRAALKNLDPRLLDDIGLAESARRDEVSRQIWDVPATWRK